MQSYLAGLRVGEIAALKVGDVFDSDGKVRDQIILKTSCTKGQRGKSPGRLGQTKAPFLHLADLPVRTSVFSRIWSARPSVTDHTGGWC